MARLSDKVHCDQRNPDFVWPGVFDTLLTFFEGGVTAPLKLAETYYLPDSPKVKKSQTPES